MAAAIPYAPYILAAAGTAADYAGQQSQKREQRRLFNRALEETNKTQQKGADMVLAQAQELSPQARQQALAAQEAATYTQAKQDLAGRFQGDGASTIIDTAGDAGNVSNDFAKAKADKALSEGTRLMQVAREAAKVRAPSGVLQKEGQSMANLTGELGDLYSTNRNRVNALQLDAQNVDEPAWGKLGKIAATIGSAWAGAGGAGALSAGAPSTTNYGLTSLGARLGAANDGGFWSQTGSRIRF